MTSHPTRLPSRIWLAVRGPRILSAASLAIVLVLALLWPSAAHAKGPTPVPPEPQGPFTVGEETPIKVRVEWPGGRLPAGMGPESLDMWGNELPWSLLAVKGSDANAATLQQGEVRPLSHLGEGTYTTSFRPPAAGEWVLVFAFFDNAAKMWRPVGIERPIQVSDLPIQALAVDDRAAPPWPLAGLFAMVGLGALLAGVIVRRVRSGANAETTGPPPALGGELQHAP